MVLAVEEEVAEGEVEEEEEVVSFLLHHIFVKLLSCWDYGCVE